MNATQSSIHIWTSWVHKKEIRDKMLLLKCTKSFSTLLNSIKRSPILSFSPSLRVIYISASNIPCSASSLPSSKNPAKH